MLFHWSAAQHEMAIMLREARLAEMEEQEARGIHYDQWSKPRYTGDPVADEWEAAIARGEAPDLGDD